MKRSGRKSAAQTPAPKKERVYGSKKNPVGSAASQSSATNIKLSEKIVDTLQDKAEKYNETHKKKVSTSTLKAVMRRGMGAYSKSHRPTITGGAPNSRQAWGFARVNKFLKKKAGEKVKKAYIQDDDLMARGGSVKKSEIERIKEELLKGQVYQNMYAQFLRRKDGVMLRYDLIDGTYKFYNDIDVFAKEIFNFFNRGYKNGGMTKIYEEGSELEQIMKPAKTIEQIAKEKNVSLDYAEEQLQKGIKTESEHTENAILQEIIALHHLDEMIDYYEKLEYIESEDKKQKGGYLKAGGEIDPDDPKIKEAMTHKAGAAGGLLVGNRHSEGGIKAVNNSTGQPIEMEGGEVVITRNAVSDDTKREFEGEMLTNREILSRINQSGGGVAFAEGGDIPQTIYTSGKEYNYGGKIMKDHEIVESCGCKHSMALGGETDYHNTIKNHLFPKVQQEPKVKIEAEVEIMPDNEHFIMSEDLGLSDGMPTLAVGTMLYSNGGNDQWKVKSFSDGGINLYHIPKSPLVPKMEDKHLTFDELIKYFNESAISIKNISTERELIPAIALVKHKIPQKSFAVGGITEEDENEDAKIMQSQFGKNNFK